MRKHRLRTLAANLDAISHLRSLVVKDVMERSKAGQCPPPVYFYISRSAAEPERSNSVAMLASIVRQLSCVEPGLTLLKPVIEKYEKDGQGFSSNGLCLDDSRELITELIERHSTTTIIIDALDECELKERQLLLDVLESILQESSLGLVKVFLSSRDDRDIVCTLQDYPNIDVVSDKNTADIEAFVREETDHLVKRRRLLRGSPSQSELKVQIIDQVSKGADGM